MKQSTTGSSTSAPTSPSRCKQDWALLAETEYRNSDSNYTTRDFDNFSLSLSVVKSF